MSRLALANGDDHPEAALKHLLDAGELLARNRPDGAAYLSGYVVECALKALWVCERGVPPPGDRLPWGRQHGLPFLTSNVAALTAMAGSRSARYLGVVTRGVASSAIGSWDPQMRYRPPTMTAPEAEAWYAIAQGVYQETLHQMRLDGTV